MVLSSILDPVLKPFLAMPPLYAIISISFIIALIITLVYRQMTDQNLMKSMKEDMKKHQKEMKELRSEPQKMMQVQKKAMEINMKYMMHSMKPTLITFIPIILIFGWLQANLAYEPILPGNEFTTTMLFEQGIEGEADLVAPEGLKLISDSTQVIEDGKAEWLLKGESGEYLLEYNHNNKNYNKEVLIITKQKYKPVTENVKDGVVKSITLGNKPLKPLNLFGWKLGWLGTYIIFSIIFSMGLRKLMKLH